MKTPIEFLQWYKESGPWQLHAGKVDPKPKEKWAETRTFSDLKEAQAFVEKWNGQRNLYFTVNPLRPDAPKASKPARWHMAAMKWFHVDMDPTPGKPIQAERERLRKKINRVKPKPSLIIDSGGGFQLFWRLAEAIPAPPGAEIKPKKGDPPNTAWAPVETYNRQLELVLSGGTQCYDVCRVMRLPMTQNIPNAKKRKSGRVPVPASVVAYNDETHLTSAFSAAEEAVTARSAPEPGPAPQEPGPVNVDALPLSPEDKALVRSGVPEGERSDLVFHITCELVRGEVDDAIIAAFLLDKRYRLSDHVYDQSNPATYAHRQVREAHKKAGGRIFNPASPLATAEVMIRDKYTAHGHTILRHVNGVPMLWASTHWREAREGTLDSHISNYLGDALQPAKIGPPVPFNPNNTKVSEVHGALSRSTFLDPDEAAAPCWLGEVGHPQVGDRPPASEILACRNGLLHLPTGKLLPKAPTFYNLNAVDFPYEPNAPEPERWFKFLKELWPDARDEDSISCLQEIFGYLLTPDTRQQKIFLMIGPKRSGKGTITRVLSGLVGKRNVTSPLLDDLGGDFGCQCLIGKQLAVISDFRIDRKTSVAKITEHLLSISGQDDKTIQRKYLPVWTGRLGVRFLLQSNIILDLKDPSGALVSRFILLRLTESFLGKENIDLTDELLTELPGILNWAIEGWSRLEERGHFVTPSGSKEMLQRFEDLSQPIAAFVRDCCVLGGEEEIDVMFTGWKEWNKGEGRDYAGTKAQFGKNLVAAYPTIKQARPWKDPEDHKKGRKRVYKGICIRNKADPEPDRDQGEMPLAPEPEPDDIIPF